MRADRLQMKVVVRLLVPDDWNDLVDLFDDGSTCRKCWCMYWRIGSAYRAQSGDRNKASFRQIVRKQPSPGLIAFDGDLAVGWCQLTPLSALPALQRAKRLKAVDEQPVWCISCFYVRKSHRRKGVTTALIAQALKVAKRAKAPAVEAYPLDARLSPSSTSAGYVSTFARAGFKEVARRFAPRPIMRHDLAGI